MTLAVSGFVAETSSHEFAGYGRPEFHWNSADGPLLGVAGEPTWTVSAGGTESAKWTVDLRIPPTATGGRRPFCRPARYAPRTPGAKTRTTAITTSRSG